MARSWTEARVRAELVAAGALLARRGLVRGSEGNLSCRLGDDAFLVTPRGADKGRLTGRDLIHCRLGEVEPERASTEWATHAAVYAAAPELVALVHAHPRAILSLALSGETPDPSLLLEGEMLVGAVATVPAWPPGSDELAAACAEMIRQAPVVVMARHGALAAGRTLHEALLRLEVVELAASLQLAQRNRR